MIDYRNLYPRTKDPSFYILSILFGIFISVIAIFTLETALRIKHGQPHIFAYIFMPKQLYHMAIFKRSRLPSLKDEQPRIFCIGGSVTHGNKMPPKESFPELLQTVLKSNNRPGTVYNFGVSGASSVATNCFVKKIISQYSPQCIIIHDGYNDIPIVLKKISDDRYFFISPAYTKPYNPYIENGILRYIGSFIDVNLYMTKSFILSRLMRIMGTKKSDLYLGFDYSKFKILEGDSERIFAENQKRIKVMFEKESDAIDYCLNNNIKVVVILEPMMKPLHNPLNTKGLRDTNTGFILSKCHMSQQEAFSNLLNKKYKDNRNVKIIDMRTIFLDRYKELYYDECHFYGKGNLEKANLIYKAISELFFETGSSK